MRKYLTLIPLVLLCYVAFSLASVVAVLMVPLALVFERFTYAGRVFHSMDCLMAAVLGWDGRHTVSAECGADRTGLCKTLCAFLDLLDPGHCAKNAKT